MPAPCGRLAAAVYVQDPDTREVVILLPGESPPPQLAALVTNPAAWDTPPSDDEPLSAALGELDPSGAEPDADSAGEAGGGVPKKTGARRSRSSPT